MTNLLQLIAGVFDLKLDSDTCISECERRKNGFPEIRFQGKIEISQTVCSVNTLSH